MSLEINDEYVLKQLAEDVGYDGGLDDVERYMSLNGNPAKTYRSKRLSLNSIQMANDLKNQGVVENKTLRVEFPASLSPNLRRHFIRGLFDGDGYISITEGKSRTNKGRKLIAWGITGYVKLLEEVNELIGKEVNIKLNPIYKKEGNCWDLRYSTSTGVGKKTRHSGPCRLDDILAIREWMYKDACFSMKRKQDLFCTIQPQPEMSGLSTSQAAAYCRMNERLFRKHMKLGHIPSYKEGYYRRVRVEDVEKFKRIWWSSDISPWDGRVKRKAQQGERNAEAY